MEDKHDIKMKNHSIFRPKGFKAELGGFFSDVKAKQWIKNWLSGSDH